VALFTTSVQVNHLFQIAEQVGKKAALKAGWEASHPKMGYLVKEAAEQSEALVQRKPRL
jgi:hypothetical protein